MELMLKLVDDKSDATEGAAAVEKLIKVEGIKLILSTQITPINLAAGHRGREVPGLLSLVTSWTDFSEAELEVGHRPVLRPRWAKCRSSSSTCSPRPSGRPTGAS